MKTLFRIFKGFTLFLVTVFLLLMLFIVGGRLYSDQLYKPKDFSPEVQQLASDLDQYSQEVEGVEVEHIAGEYMSGFHLKPIQKNHSGVIVTFGGSEGSPNYDLASSLSQQGYEVLALFFFGQENQKKELVDVPLDFFGEVLQYISNETEGEGPLTVLGASKGAELALNLGVVYPEIDQLVLYAPSAWNYFGLSNDLRFGGETRSSWNYQGQALPMIDMTKGKWQDGAKLGLDFLLKKPISFRPLYEASQFFDPNAEEARIQVERCTADILIFAGSQDVMWQSDVSARTIEDHRPERTEVHIYRGAGHIFQGDGILYLGDYVYAMGGSQEANEKAFARSQDVLVKRLKEWHT